MPIVSSLIVEDRAQIDGRRAIREQHTDQLGIIHEVQYLALSGAVVSVALAARVATIEQQLSALELATNVSRVLEGHPSSALTTAYSTLADLRTALRVIYQTGRGETIGRMAVFFNSLTNAQLQTVFGITAGQVAALRSRFQTRIDALNALLALAGE